MKYLFLFLIVIIFWLLNIVAFENTNNMVDKIFILIAVNLFGISLFLFWLGAYFKNFERSGYLIHGHAILMLSVGISFVGLGVHGLLSSGCSHLISESKHSTILSSLGMWANKNNMCLPLSILLSILGIFILWPTVKLYIGITKVCN